MAELSAEVVSFLSTGTRTGMLGYVAADGRPLVVPVWFVVDMGQDGGQLALTTGRPGAFFGSAFGLDSALASAFGFAGALAFGLAGVAFLAGAFGFAAVPDLAAGFFAAVVPPPDLLPPDFVREAGFFALSCSVFFSSAIERYSLSLAVPAPEWARKVRVGANSPSLWPTIDSEM